MIIKLNRGVSSASYLRHFGQFWEAPKGPKPLIYDQNHWIELPRPVLSERDNTRNNTLRRGPVGCRSLRPPRGPRPQIWPLRPQIWPLRPQILRSQWSQGPSFWPKMRPISDPLLGPFTLRRACFGLQKRVCFGVKKGSFWGHFGLWGSDLTTFWSKIRVRNQLKKCNVGRRIEVVGNWAVFGSKMTPRSDPDLAQSGHLGSFWVILGSKKRPDLGLPFGDKSFW